MKQRTNSHPCTAPRRADRWRGLVTLLAGSAMFACGSDEPAPQPQADPTAVIARWSGGEIRRGDIQQALANNFASLPQPVSPDARRQVVRKVVERRVRTAMLYAEAQAKGYPERPEIRFLATALEERAFAEDLLDQESAAAKASDAVVAAEIDRRLAETRSEETRKFSHIYLRAAEKDPTARQEARATLAKIQQELAAGGDFNQLAERHSTSVMARGGGRIEWTPRRQLQKAAAEAVFALAKEGDISQPVETADGLHLFRLDGIRLPVPIDAAGVRAAVRQELDNEARQAAVRSRRQQELDAQNAEFVPASQLENLEDAKNSPAWVARWKGGEVRPEELLALRGRLLPNRSPLNQELRYLVENRLLAAARRAQGNLTELEARLPELRKQAVIDTYRADLMASFDTPPTDEEVARHYRDNAASALYLRDFQLDVLFFRQQGDGIAEVYAAGEEVGQKLRNNVAFDAILTQNSGKAATICREVHGADIEGIGRASIRLRKAIVNLAEGEVSAAIYVERPVVIAPGTCQTDGPGVAFVRMRGIGTLPLDKARIYILKAISEERVTGGVTAIQERLVAESKLEILLPEG